MAMRPAYLGTLPAEQFSREVNRLLEDDSALDEIRRRASDKRRMGEVVLKAFVRLGRRGPVTMIDLRRYADHVAAFDVTVEVDRVETSAKSAIPSG